MDADVKEAFELRVVVGGVGHGSGRCITARRILLRSLTEAQLARAFQHPELGRVTLETNVQLYARQGRHHLTHVTALRERMAW